jgi:hypothetical protein
VDLLRNEDIIEITHIEIEMHFFSAFCVLTAVALEKMAFKILFHLFNSHTHLARILFQEKQRNLNKKQKRINIHFKTFPPSASPVQNCESIIPFLSGL